MKFYPETKVIYLSILDNASPKVNDLISRYGEIHDLIEQLETRMEKEDPDLSAHEENNKNYIIKEIS